MLEKLKTYIRQENCFHENDRLLLAVSGGIDSMVMADLFLQLDYPLGIAHCNFRLRGEESDKDAEFVQHFCEQHQLLFHTIRFDTEAYAKQHKLSIQMAARKLRFEWFAKERVEGNYDWILLAHQADDAVETFHINLARGCGIMGLGGIQVKHGTVVRPLLWARRTEISDYASKNQIHFREDSSNANIKYRRNLIRHRVLPELEKINPSYIQAVHESMQYLRQANEILESQFKKWSKEVVIRDSASTIRLSIPKLLDFTSPAWFVHRFLQPRGFTSEQVNDLMEGIDGQSGRVFETDEYQFYQDRDELLLVQRTNTQDEQDHYIIEHTDTLLTNPLNLQIEQLDAFEYTIQSNPNIAALDLDILKFPLTIRKWQPGDAFYPLGMNKPKKVSDFFIDEKISLPDKRNAWILCSEGDIVWIIGHRIDHRFRITEASRRIYQLTRPD